MKTSTDSAPTDSAPTTHLTVVQLGNSFFVLRCGDGPDARVTSAGLCKSKRAANQKAREVAALTGERIA